METAIKQANCYKFFRINIILLFVLIISGITELKLDLIK